MKDEKKTTYQKPVDELAKSKQGIVVYDLPEICGILDISRATALRYIKAGKLPCIKVGGRWIIERSKFEDFLQGK